MTSELRKIRRELRRGLWDDWSKQGDLRMVRCDFLETPFRVFDHSPREKAKKRRRARASVLDALLLSVGESFVNGGGPTAELVQHTREAFDAWARERIREDPRYPRYHRVVGENGWVIMQDDRVVGWFKRRENEPGELKWWELTLWPADGSHETLGTADILDSLARLGIVRGPALELEDLEEAWKRQPDKDHDSAVTLRRLIDEARRKQ